MTSPSLGPLDPLPDLDAVIRRFARAALSVLEERTEVTALRECCADVPGLVFELEERRAGSDPGVPGGKVAATWAQAMAEQIDWELYRLRVTALVVLGHLDRDEPVGPDLRARLRTALGEDRVESQPSPASVPSRPRRRRPPPGAAQ